MKDQQSWESPRSSPKPDINDLNKYRRKLQSAREKQILQTETANELVKLAETHPNARRYSLRMISLLLRVFFISTTAYTFLTLFFPIPSAESMFSQQNNLLNNLHLSLTNLSQSYEIIKENTENWPKNQSVVLVVDAASVNPSITLFNNNSIKGLLKKYENAEKYLTNGGVVIKSFEEWLSNHSKLIIDSMFLFNIQPINPNLNSFIVHIHPSNSGKGDIKIIDILKNITNIFDKFGIQTISYATDGDNIFCQSHSQNIMNHVQNNIYFVSTFQKDTLMISDPLHVLKRARYHLIPNIFNTTQIVSLLSLPTMTMRSDRASKMHDRLPLLFFQLNNFQILSKNKLYNYSFYILPFSLLLTGLSYQINYNDRLIIFHICRRLFQYIYYSPNNLLFNGQIKCKQQILNDSLSTVISLCDILNQNGQNQIHLNRLGTNPIEHDFGTIRMRSHDHHKAERFIKEAAKINAYRILHEDMIIDSIKHRDLQFGRIINTSLMQINFQLIDQMTISLINEAKFNYCDAIFQNTHLFFQKIIESNNVSNKKCYLFIRDEILIAPNANIWCPVGGVASNDQKLFNIK